MNKLVFKPKDFKFTPNELTGMFEYAISEKECAEIANELFDGWYRENIENAPKIYWPSEEGDWCVDGIGSEALNHTDYPWERKAKIVCIEEIKK